MNRLMVDNKKFHLQIKELTAEKQNLIEDPIRQKLVELQLSSSSEIALLKENIKQLKRKIDLEPLGDQPQHPPAVARLLKILNKAKTVIEI